MITDYKLIYAPGAKDMTKEVNSALAEGFQPSGPLTVSFREDGEVLLYQPMAKSRAAVQTASLAFAMRRLLEYVGTFANDNRVTAARAVLNDFDRYEV